MPYSSDIDVRAFLPDGEYLRQNASRQIILVMVLLCYHLWFQIDFGCPCNSSRNIIHCYSYLVLPSFIIVSIILWNDRRMARILRYLCYHSSAKGGGCGCKGKFCVEFITYFLQAAASGFLWCGSVLIDGDWYLCCGNSEEVMTLSCIEENELSPAEQIRKKTLMNESMVIGLICILLTVAWSFIFALPWNRWCVRKSHFRAVFEEHILEQTETILRREMAKTAADAVRKSLVIYTSKRTPATTAVAPENEEKNEDNEKQSFVKNADWKKISSLADALIESIPKNSAHFTTTV